MQAMITRLVGWKRKLVSVAIKETETRFCFHVGYRTVGGWTVAWSIFLLKIQGVVKKSSIDGKQYLDYLWEDVYSRATFSGVGEYERQF